MLFLTYWELNENMSDQERLGIAEKLNSSHLFPPEGVNILRWDGTVDAWGTVLFEADSAADAFRAINVWRAAGAGFFKVTKTSPRNAHPGPDPDRRRDAAEAGLRMTRPACERAASLSSRRATAEASVV